MGSNASDDTESVALQSVDQLVAWFDAGSKPVTARRIGIEHEKIGVLVESGKPVPYFGERGIAVLLDRLAESGEWTKVREGEHVIALTRDDRASITLEPGGQLEMSDAPRKEIGEIALQLDRDLLDVLHHSRDLNIAWLGIGMRPWDSYEEIPWVPKGRYVVMREYLPKRGMLWRDMMQRTATVQANVDYINEEDAKAKLRAAFAVTSIVTALYANSPLREDIPSGFLSTRGAAWLDMDPDRCGLLPFVFEDRPLFAAYTEWALDVPMFFVKRGADYLPANGMTFRRFLREGFRDYHATIDDWELHLSTLFPEARLKRYVEVRGADNGPLSLVRALAPLYMGILYDETSRAAATALTAGLTWQEREALRHEVPRTALGAKVHKHTVRELARELIAIADDGLARQHVGSAERALLEPLAEIVATGRTGADRILELFELSGGSREKLIEALRY